MVRGRKTERKETDRKEKSDGGGEVGKGIPQMEATTGINRGGVASNVAMAPPEGLERNPG